MQTAKKKEQRGDFTRNLTTTSQKTQKQNLPPRLLNLIGEVVILLTCVRIFLLRLLLSPYFFQRGLTAVGGAENTQAATSAALIQGSVSVAVTVVVCVVKLGHLVIRVDVSLGRFVGRHRIHRLIGR